MDTTNNTDTKMSKELSPYVSAFKIPIVGTLITVLVLIIFGFAIQQSLPGEALYTVKTDIFEDAIESTQFSVKNKAQYQITRMDNRLTEVKTLSKKETVSEKALSDLMTQTTKHTQTLEGLIAKSIDSAFSKTDVLYTLNEFGSLAGAIEAISENDPKLVQIGNSVEENRQSTVRLYKDKVLSFVQTETPQTVLEYLKVQLTEVRNGLSDESISKKTVNVVENYLGRVTNALTANNLTKAITSTGEAYRLIKMEKYSGVIIPATVDTDITTSTESTIDATSSSSTNESESTNP